jgi:hypothetical protein
MFLTGAVLSISPLRSGNACRKPDQRGADFGDLASALNPERKALTF